MIRVHSGMRLEFNLKTLQVIPDAVIARRLSKRLVKPRSESRQISKTIGEFDPGSG